MDKIIELIKWFVYPFVTAYVAITIARFHFEKDIKAKYLIAKDKVANDILNSLCEMLLSMWQLVNLKSWVSDGQMQEKSQDFIQRKQAAINNFHNYSKQSYKQLGQMGLYYGTEIVDLIAQLQTEWNEMVNANKFEPFEDWDVYRRQRILPILQRLHDELRSTVFDKLKSFKIYF